MQRAQNRRQNTEPKISYQRNGRKKHSMANTQRELRKQMLTKIRPSNGSDQGSTGLKAATEGLIIAAQDKSLATRSYHARIIKHSTDPMCRACNTYEETIDHIVSGCPECAKTEYIQRHKAVAYIYIHSGKHVSTTTSKYQTSGMNMNHQWSRKIKKLRYFGICKYTQIEK